MLAIAGVVRGRRGPVGRVASILANSRIAVALVKHIGQLRATGHAEGVLSHNVVPVDLDVVSRGAKEFLVVVDLRGPIGRGAPIPMNL